MIEIMITDYIWNNEKWCIRKIEDFDTALEDIKYCDGGISNILFDVQKSDNINNILKMVFKKYTWLNKIIVRQSGKLIGVYKRQK